MVICNCIIQEGQISADGVAALQRDLNSFAQRAFSAPAEFTWLTVPKNSGFTAGALSTSSIVSMRAAEPLAQSHRAELLNELCGIWTRITGCSLNEVVGVIADPA